MAELAEPTAGRTGLAQIEVGVESPGSNLDGAGAIVRGPIMTSSDKDLDPTEKDRAPA
jgi:hypothetical protein